MTFQNPGNVLPSRPSPFSAMVSSVLKGTLGDRPASIKVVARWTRASERTVKNWFAGTCSPRGDYFCDIVRNCPEMLHAFLRAADRTDCIAMASVTEARRSLRDALVALDKLGVATTECQPGSPGLGA